MLNWILNTPLSQLATSLTSEMLLRKTERLYSKSINQKAFKKRTAPEHLEYFRKVFNKVKIAHLAISFATKHLFFFSLFFIYGFFNSIVETYLKLRGILLIVRHFLIF